MQPAIHPPRAQELLAPLLGALPAAAISKDPPTALLPLLSPILRQRVQLLSASSSEPWLSLLCYDHSKTPNLEQAIKTEALEPHPVSGEVEVDWEYDVQVKYKRIDEETLQAMVSLIPFGIDVKLVWCVNDELGGGDGWRIGEVTVPDSTGTWGHTSIALAQDEFDSRNISTSTAGNSTNGGGLLTPAADDGDDDDYWAQYDRTPSRTPAKHSPAPPSMENARAPTDDEDYYAQYGAVQPAMDNHDPDEAHQNGNVETTLGGDEVMSGMQNHLTSPPEPAIGSPHSEAILHPRPSSSTGSSGSDMVARLERQAAHPRPEQSETAIKQHISTSMKSLYRLAKVGGIDREEFERLISTELECLSLMDEDD
ncbi:hypothetical protein GLAREA_03072 [Glarea lozoyensis ATCC 20868]|uniref:Uncharacterized protein n=1 Tax=Glarea lozoyensis (strain ATCC 20868 / MF5171) TaxID=1116229 RepID=S3DKR7_GLAL2|nr:uncharacterized protein GLAREA_03072 [Glarea lozoyensis ATCC 20868]EPE27158.1 hypothetical protein GLAREA_03072 [Glarea lozoyensis ATCC 20868]